MPVLVRIPLVLAALLLMPHSPAQAATWIVDPGGGGHATTVAGGLALASYGDSVLVRTGTYHENLVMKSGVVLRSESGPEMTVLHGSDLAPVLWCEAMGPETTIEGFTITHARGDSIGGGIVCLHGSAPTIAGNIILENTSRYGAAIGCSDHSAPLVDGNTIADNLATEEGGGIVALHETSLVIMRNQFRGNISLTKSGGAVWIGDDSSVEVRDNVFVENSCGMLGGGVWLGRATSATLIVQRNLFLRNEAGIYGGGIYGDVVLPLVRQNTFYENLAISGSGGAVWMGNSAIVNLDHNIVSRSQGTAIRARQAGDRDCNDFWLNEDGDYEIGWPGPHDLFLDPQFCDVLREDFTLAESSPCVEGMGCGLIGAYGVGCGATATVPTTWGQVKSLYR